MYELVENPVVEELQRKCDSWRSLSVLLADRLEQVLAEARIGYSNVDRALLNRLEILILNPWQILIPIELGAQ